MPTRKRKEDFRPIPVPINRGMWSGGDAASIPVGALRRVRNMLRNSGVWKKRPQFTYDNLTNVRGLGIWHDTANGKRRLVSTDSSDVVRAKGATGETWGSSVGTIAGDGVLLDSASFGGKFYGIVGNTTRAPASFFEFNGIAATVVCLDGTSTQLSGFLPLSIAQYKGRLFFGGARFSIYNYMLADGTDYAYDATTWTLTNVTAVNTTTSGKTVCRITPTNNTTASLQGGSFAVSAPDGIGSTIVARFELRNSNPNYSVPVTLQLKYDNGWLDAEAYAKGDYVAPGNGFIYRAKVAGTSAGVEPVWPTTIGNEIADNTVTWICDAIDIAKQLKIYVTDTVNFSVYSLTAKAPDAMTNSLGVLARIIFGHDGAAYTITSLDFSVRDGATNGDPAKDCHGQQVTFGTFAYPFFNGEGSASNAVDHSDYLYWTPVGEPRHVTAKSFFRVQDQPGPITAVREVDGRLCVFKRNAVTPFGAVEDPNLVVLPEGTARTGFGCLNPKALIVDAEGYARFIGEDEVYRWKPGMEAPFQLCGDAVRDEVFSKASAWVESQSFPANAALLTADLATRSMYVYAQKGKLHALDLDDDASWSVLEVGGDTSVAFTGRQICDMAYNPNTGNTVVAFTEAAAGTAGVARLDATQSAAQDSISTSGTSQVHGELWLRPFELTGPRHELLVDSVTAYHDTTADQTGQTTTAFVSFDRGRTFPKSNQVTLIPYGDAAAEPLRVALYQQGGTILLRILHSGNGGENSFNISRVEADIQVLSGAYIKTLPTAGGATL